MQQFTYNFKALGCANSLNFYAADANRAASLAQKIINEINLLERKYSRYLDNSIVSKINTHAGSVEPIRCDSETAALIDYATTCYQQSDGLFDITSGVLRTAWDFSNARLPTQKVLDETLELIGWHKVEWQNPDIRLTKKGMQIDLGGFGKEYAADKAASLAFELEINHGFINLGGDVRVFGPHLDGRPWSIGICHPRKKGEAICSIQLSHGAVASSGDYERYFELNGKRYCHIINPKTGWPVQDLQEVSVISDSCLIAGSAATITMLLGEIQGVNFLEELGLKSIIVNSRGICNPCIK